MAPNADRGDRSLWLWVAGGFLLLMLAWGVMLYVARSADTRTVPLAAKPEAKP